MIYLIENGETTGPFEAADVCDRIDDGELTLDTYAFREGMPDWRSLREALVWHDAATLPIKRSDISQVVKELFAGKIDSATARMRAKDKIHKSGRFISAEEGESVEAAIELNVAIRLGLRNRKEGMRDGAIDAFPAQELYQLSTPKFPRDWLGDWVKAGGAVINGRLVAWKNATVWQALSDFKIPAPPFSLDTGMWVRDISLGEAVELGFGHPSATPPPDQPAEAPWLLVT